MSVLRRIALWLAAFFAVAGIAYVAAFLLHDKTQDEILLQATFASLLGALSLLAGVFLVSFEAKCRHGRRDGCSQRRIERRLVKRPR